MKNLYALLPFFCFLFLVACSSDSTTESTTAAEGATNTVTDERTNPKANNKTPQRANISQEYPTAYKEHSLPQYSEASVLRASPVEAKIEENVTITLKSDKDVETIKKYYTTEMEKLGWSTKDIQMQTNEKLSKIFKARSAVSFTKDDLTLFLSANQRVDKESYINLRLLRNAATGVNKPKKAQE